MVDDKMHSMFHRLAPFLTTLSVLTLMGTIASAQSIPRSGPVNVSPGGEGGKSTATEDSVVGRVSDVVEETGEFNEESNGNPGAMSLPSLVNGLTQGNLQEAFRLLRTEYIKREDLDYLAVNRAAMQGILERLEFGAMLLTEAQRSARDSPYRYLSDRISSEIVYTRFGKFSRDELSRFDEDLSIWRTDEKVKTLVLDLRSPQIQADFGIASEILSRFRPPNELLFKIRRPGNDRAVLFSSRPNATSWGKETLLLVDSETGNVGEIIAAVLQRKNNSLVVGEKSRGLNVEYRDVSIGDDRILRYAIAEVILEDESSIFQVGVTPDLPTPSKLNSKHEVFEAVDKGRDLKDFLFRIERPRMNEAALVAGTDPELEYYLAKSNQEETKWDIFPPEDKVLQKAVDILRSRDYLDSARRKR